MAIEPVFGWVATDAAAVASIRKALESTEQGVVDELGVGVLHTGYADRFFPGTSVLLTRARYAFFVPWTFLILAEARVNRDRFPTRKLQLELRLTERLRAIYENATGAEGNGIIGVRVYPEPPAQPPDFAWWSALDAWGMYRGRSRAGLLSRWDPKGVRRAADLRPLREEEIEEDHLASFSVPPPPRDWPDGMTDGFDLSAPEAEWLRARWERLPKPSLLGACASLMKQSRRPKRRQLWDDPLVRDAATLADADPRPKPLGFVRAIEHARRASAAAEIVRATYGAFVEVEWERDQRHNSTDQPEPLGHIEHLGTCWEDPQGLRDLLLELNVDDLLVDIPEMRRGRRRVDELLREFQRAWRAARSAEDILGDRRLRSVCEQVELSRKGSRAQLPRVSGRARRAVAGGSIGAVTGIDFRWAVTRRLLTDVCDGLARG